MMHGKHWYRARTLEDLGVALRGARETTSRTQTDLAQRLHTSRATVSRAERGEPVSVAVVLDALQACGYEVVVIPRGADIRVNLGESS